MKNQLQKQPDLIRNNGPKCICYDNKANKDTTVEKPPFKGVHEVGHGDHLVLPVEPVEVALEAFNIHL